MFASEMAVFGFEQMVLAYIESAQSNSGISSLEIEGFARHRDIPVEALATWSRVKPNLCEVRVTTGRV
jgi:hypothetical protein